MDSQPSLQMPSWYLLCVHDCLPTSVRESTQEGKGALEILLAFVFGGSLGSVQRVGVPGKGLRCVGDLKDKPAVRGAALALDYPVLSEIKASSLYCAHLELNYS